MEKYAPVVVFAYARKDHLKLTLESLNLSLIAKETDLFIFCDNYKKEKDKEKVDDVRKYVDEFLNASNFKNTTVYKADVNLGLKESVIHGVTKIIAKYGKVIVVEDDLQVSKFFLEYMNLGLNTYENNEKVWSISGYTAILKSLDNYDSDVYFAGRGCSWGWATWNNRWSKIDWNVTDYKKFKHNWFKRAQFSKWGADLPPMLDAQMTSNINSWAVIWCYAAYKQNALTVYPRYSYIKNLGNDGSGLHESTSQERYDSIMISQEEFSCNFVEPFISKRIKKDFYKKYTGGFSIFIKDQIKSFLRRTHLIK